MSIAPAPASVPVADRQARLSRLASIHAALRRLDPEAQVALDPDGDRMKVLSVLPPAQVLEILRALGEPVDLLDEDDDRVADAPRAGGCGCGCRSG